MLGVKENLMIALRGGCPEWVPEYTFMQSGETKPPNIMLMPNFLSQHRKIGVGGTDIWGVEYVPTASTNGASLPKPGAFILRDIRKWRDVIKAPDISGFDWEKIAKDTLETAHVDREATAVGFYLHFGYFQHLMSFMGFEEGLCALHEEPEECKALLEYLCDFYLTVAEKMIDYIKPDIMAVVDDTAAANAPFVAPAMFREFFVPLYDRQAKFGRDRGLPIAYHNCGKCETLLEPMVKIGVSLWDPAQPINDLDAIKRKYGNRLVIAGGWQPRGRLLERDVTDEEIEESVRETIYRLAPGGGYCFFGGYMGLIGDVESERKNKVVRDAYMKYRASVYGN